jgi:hypothetical protein
VTIKHFDKLELLLPMTGTNNGTVFNDFSQRRRAITRTGVVTSTARSKFTAYGSSGLFNGSTNFLSIANGAGFQFGTGDFTIGAYFYATSFASNPNIYSQRSGVTGSGVTFRLNTSGNLQVFNGEGLNLLTGSAAATLDTWHHGEVCRVSGQYYLFLDGVLNGTVANSADVGGTATVNIGRSLINTEYFPGNMQDLYVYKGVGLHSATFTPPTRLTQRALTRTNSGTDSAAYDRAILHDFNAGAGSISRAVTPGSDGNFTATDLINLEYGVSFIKGGCDPICRGPVTVDPD